MNSANSYSPDRLKSQLLDIDIVGRFSFAIGLHQQQWKISPRRKRRKRSNQREIIRWGRWIHVEFSAGSNYCVWILQWQSIYRKLLTDGTVLAHTESTHTVWRFEFIAIVFDKTANLCWASSICRQWNQPTPIRTRRKTARTFGECFGWASGWNLDAWR